MTAFDYNRMASIFEKMADLITKEKDLDDKLMMIEVFYDWLSMQRQQTETFIAMEESLQRLDQ